MALKKSDLYSSLWASCDELRGGMDASQYKDYVLFMLFIKYITDKYGNSTDFAPPVTIPKGASFKDMVALMGKQKDGGWTCDLTPKPLIVARYFAKEQAAIEARQAELEAATTSLAELEEEHGGEEGYFGAPDRIAKAEINRQLKEIKGDKEAKEESAVQGELDRVSQTLTGRIRELADRYATPLPQLPFEVAALAARVDEHLKKMAATP